MKVTGTPPTSSWWLGPRSGWSRCDRREGLGGVSDSEPSAVTLEEGRISMGEESLVQRSTRVVRNASALPAELQVVVNCLRTAGRSDKEGNDVPGGAIVLSSP